MTLPFHANKVNPSSSGSKDRGSKRGSEVILDLPDMRYIKQHQAGKRIMSTSHENELLILAAMVCGAAVKE